MKRFLMTATIVLAFVTARANAIMMTTTFDTTGLNVGDTLNVDIGVSGLQSGGTDQIVSGFDFDLLYTSALISPTGVSFGNELGTHPGGADGYGDCAVDDACFLVELGFGLPPLVAGSLALTGISYLSDADLDALQDDDVYLATVSFEVLDAALGQLSFDYRLNQFLDVKGRDNKPILPERDVAVPEPGSLALIAIGLGLLAAARRRGAVRPEHLPG